MNASMKLAAFILACFLSTALSTPTCKAKPSAEDVEREQWKQRWTSKSTEAAAPSDTPTDDEGGKAPIAVETSPEAGDAKSADEATTPHAGDTKPDAEGNSDSDAAEGTSEKNPAERTSDEEAADGTSHTEEITVENETAAQDEDMPAKGEDPTAEGSKASDLPAEEANTSSPTSASNASAKQRSSEDSISLGDVTSSAFSSAFSAHSSAHSASSQSDWEYVGCEEAGGTLSNIKALRFCYFENGSVEICACPLNIFNDFDLELDDIEDKKYSHYFENDACYFKKKSP